MCLIAAMVDFSRFDYAKQSQAVLTEDVKNVTGRDPQPFSEYIANHVSLFKEMAS